MAINSHQEVESEFRIMVRDHDSRIGISDLGFGFQTRSQDQDLRSRIRMAIHSHEEVELEFRIMVRDYDWRSG